MQSENPKPLDAENAEDSSAPATYGDAAQTANRAPDDTPQRDAAVVSETRTDSEPVAAPVENNGVGEPTAASVTSPVTPPTPEADPVQPPVSLFSRPSRQDGTNKATASPSTSSSTMSGATPTEPPSFNPQDSTAPADPAAPRAWSAQPQTPPSPVPLSSTYQSRPQYTPPPVQPAQPELSPTSDTAEQPKGLLDLYDSEELVCEVDSGDDGRFVLTSQRLIYQGRSAEGSVFSAAAVEDVTAIEFGRRPRDARSAWWGVVGLLAAIAVWQVTTSETVGAVAGAVVAGISLLLLADYWFRPAGLVLRFGTAGGTVQGPVSSKRVRDAEQLAARVQQMRGPRTSRRAGNSGRPPGGSPGLG